MAQERAELQRAAGLLGRLEKEISELRQRDAELEQLSHTEDHVQFLQVGHYLDLTLDGLVIQDVTTLLHLKSFLIKLAVATC